MFMQQKYFGTFVFVSNLVSGRIHVSSLFSKEWKAEKGWLVYTAATYARHVDDVTDMVNSAATS